MVHGVCGGLYCVMVPMVPTVSVVVYCAYSVYGAYICVLYVKELLGDNRHLYETFISHTDIDSFYDIVLGNTMPLALSTSLQLSIVLSRTPIVYVTPDNVANNICCLQPPRR